MGDKNLVPILALGALGATAVFAPELLGLAAAEGAGAGAAGAAGATAGAGLATAPVAGAAANPWLTPAGISAGAGLLGAGTNLYSALQPKPQVPGQMPQVGQLPKIGEPPPQMPPIQTPKFQGAGGGSQLDPKMLALIRQLTGQG